ncbi:hypothetical protein [Spongiactinospora sp. 9N601]|uniref:hypothetical protein n=1 Tax=Spongiactinospora sp. 9N601 TaxID=3375149 RepID=UPI00379ABFE7
MIGTGGLARSICYSLAGSRVPTQVSVVGRDIGKAAEICYVAGARAFAAITVDLDLLPAGAALIWLALALVAREQGPALPAHPEAGARAA